MSRPDARRLFASMEATWPPATTRRLGPAVLREGQGGGSRVSAATVAGVFTGADIEAAEAAMREMGESRLWMIPPGAGALDETLAARGYRVKDPVWLYLAPLGALAEEPPRVSTFSIWPPLAIMPDLWAEGDIGPERLAVMERVAVPKTGILGRAEDHPAGVAFVAVADRIAWLHALYVPERMRRKGAAARMVARAALWAQGIGADWFALAVTRANEPANALYASLGMEIVEQYHYRIHQDD